MNNSKKLILAVALAMSGVGVFNNKVKAMSAATETVNDITIAGLYAQNNIADATTKFFDFSASAAFDYKQVFAGIIQNLGTMNENATEVLSNMKKVETFLYDLSIHIGNNKSLKNSEFKSATQQFIYDILTTILDKQWDTGSLNENLKNSKAIQDWHKPYAKSFADLLSVKMQAAAGTQTASGWFRTKATVPMPSSAAASTSTNPAFLQTPHKTEVAERKVLARGLADAAVKRQAGAAASTSSASVATAATALKNAKDGITAKKILYYTVQTAGIAGAVYIAYLAFGSSLYAHNNCSDESTSGVCVATAHANDVKLATYEFLYEFLKDAGIALVGLWNSIGQNATMAPKELPLVTEFVRDAETGAYPAYLNTTIDSVSKSALEFAQPAVEVIAPAVEEVVAPAVEEVVAPSYAQTAIAPFKYMGTAIYATIGAVATQGAILFGNYVKNGGLQINPNL